MSYFFLGLNIFGAALSGFTFGHYYFIYKAMKTRASLLLLFLPASTVMMSVYRIASWYLSFKDIHDPCEISFMLIWHTISVCIILSLCCFQLLILIWRPTWFRKERKTDRRSK